MERLNSKNTFETNEEELSEIKDIKKPIITFAKFNKYFFILILSPIFFVLTNLFLYLIEDIGIVKRSELLNSIIDDLSYIFAGLFYFISYFKVNSNKNKESYSNSGNNNSGVIYIYNEGILNNYNQNKIIILIILLSLIIGIDDILYIFIGDRNVFEIRIYFLFFIPLFSKFIISDIYLLIDMHT